MSYVDFVSPAMQFAKQAASKDEAKEYEEAYKLYIKSVEFFMTAIKRKFIVVSCFSIFFGQIKSTANPPNPIPELNFVFLSFLSSPPLLSK